MKLFYKRPLCLILCIMLGGFCFSANVRNVFSIILASISFGFLISIFIFKNIIPSRIVLTRVCVIAFIISLLLGILFSYAFYPTKHYDKETVIEGVIVDADHTDTSYSTMTIKTDKIDEKRDAHKISVIGSKDELSGLNIGDRITAKITIRSIRDYNSRSYYLSRGISASGDDINDITITEKDVMTFSGVFASMRRDVCDRLRNLTDKRTGDFLSALLTGERVVVDPAISLSFARTGTTHILALSGAHLVILAYAVSLVLKAFCLGKRIRTVITALAVAFYVPFTGMSASVTRAGVMVLITSFIFLVARKSDGPTTLALSIFLIILAQPFAIYDIALWLSALATLGLLLLSALLNKRGKPGKLPKRALKAFTTASLASVFAISASFIISLFFFDGFSTLALPATLVLSVLTEILIYISILALIFGRLIPLGKILICISNITFEVTDWFSSYEYAYIPLDFWLVGIIAVILVAAFLYLLIFASKKHKKLSILVLTAIFLTLNTVGILQSVVVKNKDEATFYSDAGCNVVTVRSDGEYVIIATGGSKNTEYAAVNAASNDKITRIDRLIIPGYTYYTIDFVNVTLKSIYVDTLMLPAPLTQDEYECASYITDCIRDFDTEIIYFYDGDEISIGDATFKSVSHSQASASRHYDAFTIASGSDVLLYLSADAVIDNYVATREVVNVASTIIVGGAKRATSATISIMPSSAGEIIFGQRFTLSPECEKFIKEKGVSVKYTDTPVKIN